MGVHVIGEDSRHRPKAVRLNSRTKPNGSPCTLKDYGLFGGCEVFVEDMSRVMRGQRPLAAQEVKRREKMVEVTIQNFAVTGEDVPVQFECVSRPAGAVVCCPAASA